MATNFDYLLFKKEFEPFAFAAVEAEKALMISPANCAILTRRALELGVKFMYSIDSDLEMPYQDNLSALVHEPTFMNIIDSSVFPCIKYIIQMGNKAVHTANSVKREDAVLLLRDLFVFFEWIDYSYAEVYEVKYFNEDLLVFGDTVKEDKEKLKSLSDELAEKDKTLEELLKENKLLREKMTSAKQEYKEERTYTPDTDTEAETRKRYIDQMLKDAGWKIGSNCLEEVEVTGMKTSKTGKGYVDYVLFGKDQKPLAVVEAKKSACDPLVGIKQAQEYADCLYEQYHRRPLIFNTNGFETYYTDDYNNVPKRQVFSVFTQDELQLEIDRRKIKKPLVNIEINDKITDRPYQKEAINAICDAINKGQRRMLIVQATGSGKTRVSVSLVDVLRRHNHVKNILFLADRKELVKQAKNAFTQNLPDLSCCNLLDSKDDPENSRMIFSTYPTMLNAIDEQKRKDGQKLFTSKHFDLIITDEAHRSIYKKYGEIFDYFDAMLVGMTATPKADIDKNTYSVFNLESGVPTYAYELEEAVKEGYLVSYTTKEYKTNIMENGIKYDQLSDEEKEEFEDTFYVDPAIEEEREIPGNAINDWVMNYDTIDMVLKELVANGYRVEGGDKLGKTIIFARKREHARLIVERFNKLFPEMGTNFIQEIDYSIKHADTIIDDFKVKTKEPQIAVSVDMLDTGIDVPEILNLVFFKRVMSYAKFWQMIGRGTRLCKDLFGDGQDKKEFRIFDFCGNFDFFRVNPHGKENGNQASITEKSYIVKAQIARELQDTLYASDEDYASYREDLVESLRKNVIDLNNDSFLVKSHFRQVETYRVKESWSNIDTVAMSDIKNHIAPIIRPEGKDELARRFDYIMYSMELGKLQSKNISSPIKVVVVAAELLSAKKNIPAIENVRYILEEVQKPDFWDDATILDMDAVRDAMRELIQYIDKVRRPVFYTEFEDTIIEKKDGEPIYATTKTEGYKKKVEAYLKAHQDNIAIYKLRHNKKLTAGDMETLEKILWKELGSREDYEKEYGQTPVGRLVRRIAGVDREELNKAFSEFLSEEKLNINQIRFVRLIIDYIAVNGNIEDNTVFTRDPFKTAGSIMTLFKQDMGTAKKIMDVVKEIKDNSEETA